MTDEGERPVSGPGGGKFREKTGLISLARSLWGDVNCSPGGELERNWGMRVQLNGILGRYGTEGVVRVGAEAKQLILIFGLSYQTWEGNEGMVDQRRAVKRLQKGKGRSEGLFMGRFLISVYRGN